jgi:hypothetical protein
MPFYPHAWGVLGYLRTGFVIFITVEAGLVTAYWSTPGLT